MSDEKYGPVFHHPAEFYTRKIDMVAYAIRQAAFFVSKKKGISCEEAEKIIREGLRQKKINFKDPKVTFFHREIDGSGDRVRKETTLRGYLSHTEKNRDILAPTFTTYCHPDKKRSIIGIHIGGNIKLRSLAKKAMFAAKMIGDMIVYALKKIEQTGRKLGNNAISGTHVSPSTPLSNPTGHSTLTSGCRTTSAYGNANNEKFLSGNRHYYSKDVVLNNICAILTNVDYDAILACMNKYKLHYPTVEETMNCILYSTRLYWWDAADEAKILELVATLTPIERAAFVYIGDAHHLFTYNDQMFRQLIASMGKKVTDKKYDDPLSLIKKAPPSYLVFAHQLCKNEMMGVDPGNYEKVSMENIQILAATCENIADSVWSYRDLIQAFWMSNNVPASVAFLPTSIRRSALTSDTDSTIFTVQSWVMWYCGKLSFDEKGNSAYATMVFLTSSTIRHVLAMMSANIGITTENIFRISMKSEYCFDVFIPTNLGKHYWACISGQEGRMYKELDWEIKGAQLKSANAPRPIIKAAKEMMKQIILDVMNDQKVYLTKWLDYVADQENEIVRSIKQGSLAYFRSTSIKDAKSYTGPADESPYANHFLWEKVFAPKYGSIGLPPYSTVKINVLTTSGAKMKRWLDEMEDQELAERFRQYLAESEKKNFATYNLPADILSTSGVPKEIRDIIDLDKILHDTCRVFYILLESIGYYALGKKVKRLVSQEGWGNHRHQTLKSAEESDVKINCTPPPLTEQQLQEIKEA